ncbi:MAG: tetratricopeptide repeat protein [Vicinamibacteria bacterium]
MAKINPVKVKQDAEKLEKEGKLDKAIALYRQITDDNPRDWNTINKIGDLYAKLNRTREAGEEYAKVADFYAKDGFLLKAIALWKKINRLDATALEPYLNLADLYAKQGLMMEAKSQYQIVVDEYIKRGRARDAGDVLRKMADIDPSDLKIQSKLADLYLRDGNTAKAIEVHVGIADELTKKGHLNEALQVLEKGLRIDAKSVNLRGEMARIHLVQKNFEKAAQYLEDIVRQSPQDTQMLFRLGEAYVGSKKIEEAEAIFKRLLEIDPEDNESRIQMGRVYLMQGQHDEAYAQFLPVVDKLLERKEGEKAAALLQLIVQKNASHVKSLSKLVEVYRVLRKDMLVSQTYSQLTEAYISQGEYQQAADVLSILVEAEPQNAQHRTKLEFVRNKQKGGGAPAARPKATPPSPAAAPAEMIEEEFEIPSSDEAPAFLGFEEEDVGAPPATPARAPAAPAAPAAIELSGPLSDEDKEFIDEHLAEGRVFRKYGLVDKAADQFEAVVARFPDNVAARIELRDVFKEKGLAQKAAEQSSAIAEVHRMAGDQASADTFDEEARSLVPGAPSPAATPAPQPRPKAAPPKGPAIEVAPEEAEGEVDISVDLEEGGIESPVEVAEEAPEVASFDLDVEESAGGDLPEQFVDEPEPLGVDEPAAAVEPAVTEESAVSFTPTEEEISLEEPVVEEPEPTPAPAPPPPRPAPPRAKPAAPPQPARPRLPPDLQKTLDEVDSYVSLGFVDDAKDALREVMGRHPGHAAIAAKIAELGLDLEEEAAPVEKKPARPSPRPAKAPQPQPSPIEEALSDLAADVPEPAPTAASLVDEAALPQTALAAEPAGGIDLGAELGELFSAQSAVEEAPAEASSTDLGDAGLADIFKEFKKGVDKQLGKEDYDTRYNLGIAYKEMGLVDEAIAEFQLAAKDENRILECSSMLGICFMEKGMPKLAVKWFEKGLKAPGRSPEEYLGLRYDLAMAHEAAGEADTALEIFTEIHGEDASFRDVAAKVRDLRGALG